MYNKMLLKILMALIILTELSFRINLPWRLQITPTFTAEETCIGEFQKMLYFYKSFEFDPC